MVQSEVSHICRAGQWGSVLTDYRVSGCPVLIYKYDQAFLGKHTHPVVDIHCLIYWRDYNQTGF